ncbi:alpha,alpha-trehalose-phosphate synthase (UDP-forming) [Desulfovibrio ferrophilus]|uniref:Trehalose 6-phosphate synthase n=1 Tax=Desulfovibrio ferrophilus TaxID=241368 RepID=A0A2Z6AX34_9BACT|nr:trehalose-6-phosphate synthase [Desulfovibrio ferrophilus]BBD07791.1 trehalose 6-phosphate synthase [Desulfovibrio ferrophilus]
MSKSSKRLVVVSNRLPIALKKQGDSFEVHPGKGGLVTALAPVLRDRGGDWIGWTGATGDVDVQAHLDTYSRKAGYNLVAVPLSQEQVQGYYQGFSNEVIWPLFHDLQTLCNFDPAFFQSYLEVNQKFASAIANQSDEDAYVWVQDYHLMHAAWSLKQQNHKRRCGFFLHIPFPPPDIFLKLPWRKQIIEALLEFDLVGFQTVRDRRNFVQCVGLLRPDAKLSGRGQVVSVNYEQRELRVGYFPISIDFKEFQDLARTRVAADLAHQVHAAFRRRILILGADRLDYSKGIPERIQAMLTLYSKYPEVREKLSLVQIVVPSREDILGYKDKKLKIESMVSEVNGKYSQPGWVPIHYLYRNLSREELVAYYRVAAIALVTPLKDGMNLVAKEYCACDVSGQGVLVLSEFAGAAAQLQRGALLVNPHDVEGVADAVYRAYVMGTDEKQTRMHKLKTIIRKYDIYWWVDSFLNAGFGTRLDDFRQDSVDFHTER